MFFVADFETRTLSDAEQEAYDKGLLHLKDVSTHVWGWGFSKVGASKDSQIRLGTDLDSFMEMILNYKSNISVYFHNLKFDGNFLLSWLLSNGYKVTTKTKNLPDNSVSTLINETGAFYSITVNRSKRENGTYHKITFYDSYKKLPFSEDRIAKAFHLPYQKVEVEQEFYTRVRPLDHELTEEEKGYIRNDIRVIALAIEILKNQDMNSMTIGSDALTDYKRRIGTKSFRNLFPVLEKEVDDDIKLAYRGGVSMVKESIRNKDIGKGKTFDVNSMYPYVMRYKPMPFGAPLFYEGKYEKNDVYNLFIQELSCEFKLKKDKLPTIQIKGQPIIYSPREYLTESKGRTTLHLTNVDLELFLDHYHVYDIEYHSGYMFRSSTALFKDYIDHWTEVKETSVGAMRELAKLMLNSLYGKFGTKTVIASKIPRLNSDGIIKYDLGEPEIIESIYSAVAVFTTSYGRDLLLRTSQANYDRFCYCDTDSIHVTGTEPLVDMELHPTKLGYWDDEGTFDKARFVGAKCYVENFIYPEKAKGLKVVCAGMTKAQHSQVTYENFREGLVVTGKLQPKVVKGGVVLVQVDYAVKVRGSRF